ERRQCWLQTAVERKQLAGDTLSHSPFVVARLDLEVTPQQVDHRRIGRGLTVGHAGRLKHQTVMGAMRVSELPKQPRLADTGFANHRDHLAASAACKLKRFAELRQFACAPNELRQTARGVCFEARAYRICAGKLVNL